MSKSPGPTQLQTTPLLALYLRLANALPSCTNGKATVGSCLYLPKVEKRKWCLRHSTMHHSLTMMMLWWKISWLFRGGGLSESGLFAVGRFTNETSVLPQREPPPHEHDEPEHSLTSATYD